jgi:GntR family transcriptional regulator / MocR family aminotransferase
VVQLYAADTATGVTLPAQQLIGFARVDLKPGASKSVAFVVPLSVLAYLITSATLAHRFAAAKWMMDRHTSLLEQMALADFIEDGRLERHVRRMRRLYQQRRMALVSALDHHFGQAAEILGDQAGMHILVRFRNVEREPDPARDGVRLTSASKYYFSSTRQRVRDGVHRHHRARAARRRFMAAARLESTSEGS